MVALRQYLVVGLRRKSKATEQPHVALEVFTALVLKILGVPDRYIPLIKPLAAPTFDWFPEIVGFDETVAAKGMQRSPLEVVIALAIVSDEPGLAEAALKALRTAVQERQGQADSETGIRVLGVGADLGAGVTDHYCPARPDRVTFADRANAHVLLRCDALAARGLTGARVNVVVIDEGLDKTRIPPKNWGGGWARTLPNGDVLHPGATQPAAHGTMMVRNILDVAPDAVIYDVPLVPRRIRDVQAFLHDAEAAYWWVTGVIAILRGFPFSRWSGPWVLVNAWAIFDRTSEAPLGDYTENLSPLVGGHPFNHALARAVRHGLDVVFGAGNCGQFCPSQRCGPRDRGPGHSIWGANAHPAVLSVGAVLSDELWLGYSSQGPGPDRLEKRKPDVCAPSDFREREDAHVLNTGTSAACALAAGVVAALRSRWTAPPPQAVKQAIIDTARKFQDTKWNERRGHGIIDAEAAATELAVRFP